VVNVNSARAASAREQGLFSLEFTWQKMNYMHNNPVASGLVEKAEDYLYSSARDYVGKGKGLLEIDPV